MMISRPMNQPNQYPLNRGSSVAPMQPLNYLKVGTNAGYPRAMKRTSPFTFKPRPLPPVNKVTGSPRLYG
jgi:hypothetical protein